MKKEANMFRFANYLVLMIALPSLAFTAVKDYPIQPVPFTSVKFQDAFWAKRLETNRTVTIPFDFKKCEETGRIDNFAKAGRLMAGEFRGIRYDDSDVFKIIEGASYSLAVHPDPSLEAYLDGLIAKIAAAQERDGYLYTARTINPDRLPPHTGVVRWAYLSQSHELYNVGHMYEAAVAHFLATGKRSFLGVALKNADLIAKTFGPSEEQLHGVPGHQEIEIGLVKLFRITGDEKYLNLARYFLDQRGSRDGHVLYGAYAQDHIPVLEQKKPVGHAVRANYMYSGMADIAALTGDESTIRALDGLWTDVVSSKQYLTGGVGARHDEEAFGEDYELPNATAYCETCAAIANGLWNFRMFLLHGESKYIDVLERILYNGFLSGISLSGDQFFYTNPLESDGKFAFNIGKPERQPWFDCSCCPSNVVRFLPSLPGYVYAAGDNGLYVNLFVGGEGKVRLPDGDVTVVQKTDYPWDGKISILISPAKPAAFAVRLRIPCWAGNTVMPSDLYRFDREIRQEVRLSLNGKAVDLILEKGYAVIDRSWNPGDRIELVLPMSVRRVLANEAMAADRGLAALERGPVVFCLEGADNGGDVLHLVIPDDAQFKTRLEPSLLGGVQTIRGEAVRLFPDGSREGWTEMKAVFKAIPYYAWANRGANEMRVWVPRTADAAKGLFK
jgi:DUF1680 family protein